MTTTTMPKRLRYRRGERLPAGAKLVTRASRWGNPYPLCWHRTRQQAVAQFAELLAFRIARAEWLCEHVDLTRHDPDAYPSDAEIRKVLAGFDLACACRVDQACHADHLLRVANSSQESLW